MIVRWGLQTVLKPIVFFVPTLLEHFFMFLNIK